DDPVVRVLSAAAGAEGSGRQAPGRKAGEDRIVEEDVVERRFHVEDEVDIAAAQRGGEGEVVGSAVADGDIGAAAPVDGVDPGIAVNLLSELVAGEVERRGAARIVRREHVDVL